MRLAFVGKDLFNQKTLLVESERGQKKREREREGERERKRERERERAATWRRNCDG